MRDSMEWTCGRGAAVMAAVLAVACGGGGSGTGSGGGAGSAPASLGALTGTSQLADVAVADGATELRTGAGPLGYDDVRAIALDPVSGSMYGVWAGASAGGGALLRIDPAAGADGLVSAPTVIGGFGDAGTPSTLVWHEGQGVLYGVLRLGPALLPGKLLRIDPATGVAEVVGDCAKVSTLTHDPVTDILYGTRGADFHSIDPATGASVLLFSDSSELPAVTALTIDPATGALRAAAFEEAAPEGPRILGIDLSGGITDLGSVDEVLVDLERDTAGALIGLGSGGSIADINPVASEFEVDHRGNVGVDPVDFAFDATDGGYWAIDGEGHLVKFHTDGASRTFGRVALETRQIVHDPLTGELWGIGFGDVFTSTDRNVYGLDPKTADLTTTPVPAQVSSGSRFVQDYTVDVLRASSGLNDVSVVVDPMTGLATVTATSLGLDGLVGLTWDPVARRLVALTVGAAGEHRRLVSWDPNVSGQATLEAVTDALGSLVERAETQGEYVTLEGRDLLRIRPGVTAKSTMMSVRDDLYYATTRVETDGRIFAAAREDVFAIDPATGETELVGSTPGGDRPSGLAWDAARDQLGFIVGDEIRWTNVTAPDAQVTETPLGGRDVDDIAYSAERDLHYLVGPGGVFTMERVGGSGAVFVELNATAPPDVVQDIAWQGGALWAATRDDRLFRVDPDSGAWTEVGTTPVELQGLH